MKKVTFVVSGMHCTSCAMSIDGELEDTEGVEEANTSYAKGKTEVSFDEKKVKESDLIQTIARVGYQAAEA